MFPASDAFLMILVTPCYWGRLPIFSLFSCSSFAQYQFSLKITKQSSPISLFRGHEREIFPSLLAVDPSYLSFHFNREEDSIGGAGEGGRGNQLDQWGGDGQPDQRGEH